MTTVRKCSVPPSDIVLCINASFGRGRLVDSIIPKDIFPHRYISDTKPSEEFKEAKESGKPIVLVVLGPNGHDGIKYLCDDYDKPTAERRVKWVHSIPAGVDWYKLELLQKEMQGLPLTNGKSGYNYYLALHVIYSILYFNRETARLQKNKHERKWDMFDMVEPQGQKVGIVGYGEIGRATAEMLKPLNMDITGVRRSIKESERDKRDDLGVLQVSGDDARDRVIAESDYIVNILPATQETRGMFNKSVFAKMKNTAVYINVGRGSTQNEADLCEALHAGVIAGASLDVFEEEPLSSASPLFDVPDEKMLITSHNACITVNSFRETVSLFTKSARQYLQTGEIVGYFPDISLGY